MSNDSIKTIKTCATGCKHKDKVTISTDRDEELASMLMILKGWSKAKALRAIRTARASIVFTRAKSDKVSEE